jgi:uncharacterized repeat protein (TIGR01451 family)
MQTLMNMRRTLVGGGVALVAAAAFAVPASAWPNMPDLAVSISGPQSVEIGDTATFVVKVANGGLVSASNVTLIDELPAGFNFVAAWTTSGNCFGGVGPVTCSFTGVQTAETIRVTIIARAAASGVYTNVVRLTSESRDANYADHGAGVTVEVPAHAVVAAPQPASPVAAAPAAPLPTVAPASPTTKPAVKPKPAATKKPAPKKKG